MRLSGRLVEIADLSADDRRAMLLLMDRHYANVDPHEFEKDLAEKQWAIQVRNSSGELCGFSTQMVLSTDDCGRPVKALFSGDTIIDRQYWGDSSLMRIGGMLAQSLVDTWPDVELYWFLISQGYKTYRFLPLFFREFYPRRGVATPDGMREVIDALARNKFADRYDAAAGVVRGQANQYRLRTGVADVTAARLQDVHVDYFVQRNPGHARGDELCCLAPLRLDNFTEAAGRVLRRGS